MKDTSGEIALELKSGSGGLNAQRQAPKPMPAHLKPAPSGGEPFFEGAGPEASYAAKAKRGKHVEKRALS